MEKILRNDKRKDMPMVIVANAFRQHTHQLVYALQKHNLLKAFFTGFWYKPEEFPYLLLNYLPKRVKNFFEKELQKRYFKEINPNYIYQIPFPEIKYRFILPWCKNKNFYINRYFSKLLAEKINKMDFDIFIGYELCSLESFEICKEKNKICIYDLASVAYNFQYEAYLKYKEAYISEELNYVIDIKKKEIDLADYFLVPSLAVKNSLISLGVNADKIELIPYGIDINTFIAKKDYKKNDNKVKILFVEHLQLYKGIEYLLESVSRLKNYNIELILVGKMGDAKDILKKYRGLYKHISYLPHNVLKELYQEADIFILPSLIEGFGQVTIEAMASGTPVIVSDRTGSVEAVRDSIDGFIVPSADVEALTSKILFFLNNKEMIEKMGKNAVSQARKYTWENYRERVRMFVERVSELMNKT